MKSILISFFILALSCSIFCQEKISVDNFIKIISKKLPEFEQQNIILEKAENNLTKARSIYDVNLSGSFEGYGNQIYMDGQDINSNYSPGFKSDLNLSSTLPSGTKISSGVSYNQIFKSGKQTQSIITFQGLQENEFDYENTTYDPKISISVTQPLLYNWFGFLDRYSIKDAKNKIKIEKIKTEINKKNILAYYEKLYFKWIEKELLIDSIKLSLENARKIEAQTLLKLKKGLAENDDYQRSKYSVVKLIDQLEALNYEYEIIKKELGLFIDLKLYKVDSDEYEKRFNNIIDETIKPVKFEKTGNAKILNLNKESLEAYKKAKQNNMMPKLDLFGNLDIKFHIYDSIIENDYEREKSLGDIDFTAGIQLSMPLGNIKARAEKKEVYLMIKDILLEYEKTENDFNNQFCQILEYEKYLKNNLALKNESLKIIQSKYETEKEKYKQGRMELKDILDSEDVIINEKTNKTKIKTALIINYIEYQLLTY